MRIKLEVSRTLADYFDWLFFHPMRGKLEVIYIKSVQKWKMRKMSISSKYLGNQKSMPKVSTPYGDKSSQGKKKPQILSPFYKTTRAALSPLYHKITRTYLLCIWPKEL